MLETKSGREYYTATLFVDATGDGDLMYRAGIPTAQRGNFHTYEAFFVTLESCKRAVEEQDISRLVARKGAGSANLYGGGHPADIPLYDGTTCEEVNRYLIKNQLELLDKIKEYPRNEMDIVTLPGMAQFRTTRHVDGAYTLLESDAFRHFEDSVALICDFDRRDYLFEVPYRTLYSEKAINVITCGRSAAADGYAWDVSARDPARDPDRTGRRLCMRAGVGCCHTRFRAGGCQHTSAKNGRCGKPYSL